MLSSSVITHNVKFEDAKTNNVRHYHDDGLEIEPVIVRKDRVNPHPTLPVRVIEINRSIYPLFTK